MTLLITGVVGETKKLSNLGNDIEITIMSARNNRVLLDVSSTHTPSAVSSKKHNPQLTIALRNEIDCFNALVKHTNGCDACLDMRIRKDQNGLGCDIGRMCKDEWIIAARRRYELSTAYTASREDQRTVTA